MGMAFWNIGSGEEGYVAYVGDAFTDGSSSSSSSGGMFPFAYCHEELPVAYGHSRWPEAQVFFGRDGTGTLGALAETGVSGADAQTAKSASSAVVVATIPSSGGRYVITRTAVKLPDGRVLLYYNVWFYDDMVNFVGLSSTKRLVKQIAMTVDPDALQETQARYDNMITSLVAGLKSADTLNDLAKALEDTREAAEQEGKDLLKGALIGKLAKMGRVRRLSGVADDAARYGDDAARAAKLRDLVKRNAELRERLRKAKTRYDELQGEMPTNAIDAAGFETWKSERLRNLREAIKSIEDEIQKNLDEMDRLL